MLTQTLRVGQRFGRLVVRTWRGQAADERYGTMVLCVCDCGQVWEGPAKILRRTSHPQKSCGQAHLCHCGRYIRPTAESIHRQACVRALLSEKQRAA